MLPPMEPLTAESLAALARERGLALTERELQGLVPLVQAGRVLIEALDRLDLAQVEPASQYRIL
jgi:hypothetical protein